MFVMLIFRQSPVKLNLTFSCRLNGLLNFFMQTSCLVRHFHADLMDRIKDQFNIHADLMTSKTFHCRRNAQLNVFMQTSCPV